jgi:AraC family transcriptional regulator
MNEQSVQNHHDKPVDRVVNFIYANLKEDLSLDRLASIANYSPFHFQKMFKEMAGVTPKQFVILARLKSATGMLMVDKPKPISIIAYDCGFSSPSVFSRTFKNHFGVSAEQLRSMPEQERLKFITCQSFVKELMHHPVPSVSSNEIPRDVKVKIENSLSGFITNISLQKRQVINGFRKSLQVAETSQPHLSDFRYAGVIYPHHDLYRAMVISNSQGNSKNPENYIEIRSGRFATLRVNGPIDETFKAINNFYNNWLPGSGYRVADIFIIERLADDPIRKPYDEIEREVQVPIEPV